MFKYSLYACVIGFIIDLVLGDPNFKYHPIRLIGRLIELTEKMMRTVIPDTPKGLRFAGMILVIIVCLVSCGATGAVLYITYRINICLGIICESVICYFFIAAKSLKKESMCVYERLIQNDISGARQAVGMIVGRDTQALDEKGITKAAVETVAENLSDGVIAPLIFMLFGGGVFGALYKAVNTMDSMVGYKNDKYLYFGYFAAKTDDIFNFIPSRLSALAMLSAAFILKMDYKNALKIFKRDRFNHASPNSAQTEAVCAGALGIKLAGDAYYFGKLYKKPYIGDEINEIEPDNIKQANSLMYTSSVITMVFFGFIRLWGGILL